MSPLLIALLGIMLLPLFVGTWRTSLLGLSCQGLLLTWLASRGLSPSGVADEWVTMLDLFFVRGIGAPLALYLLLSKQKAPARNDVIPPNLVSWTLALGLVLVAFNFAERLEPMAGQAQTLLAVAGSGLLLGFLVLSTQGGPFSQVIGVLRIENAIVLFELGGHSHHETLLVHTAQVIVLVASIALYRWYLATLNRPAPSGDAAAEPEELPSL